MRPYRHGGIESTELMPAREQRLSVLILSGEEFSVRECKAVRAAGLSSRA